MKSSTVLNDAGRCKTRNFRDKKSDKFLCRPPSVLLIYFSIDLIVLFLHFCYSLFSLLFTGMIFSHWLVFLLLT